ncbi:unnamed protein product [Symbiodinium sp. CCMP2592]|nr:unnamed protein product [Symbiodinium sp. CCMP2592]
MTNFSQPPRSEPVRPDEAADVAGVGADVDRTSLPRLPMPFSPTPLHPANLRQPTHVGHKPLQLQKPACSVVLQPSMPFACKPLAVSTAPARVRGCLRTALRTGLRLAVHPSCPEDEVRGWMLFCVAPRMLLYRSPGDSRVPTAELDRRFDAFRAGLWTDLLREAAELLAAGNSDTLAELRDPQRRPHEPYAPLPQAPLQHNPDQACPLPLQAFLDSLRSARRSFAAGPSGATNEHIRVLLDDEVDARLLHGAALRLAKAEVPLAVVDGDGMRVARIVALRKLNGRAEGGEQGDPLMPAFYALAQHG